MLHSLARSESPNFHLMHNIVRFRAPRIVTKWVENEIIQVILWTLKYLDLNSISHVWGVSRRLITLHVSNIHNAFRFRKLLTEERARLPQRHIDNITLSMNKNVIF